MRGARRVSMGLTVWMLALLLAAAAMVGHAPRAAADFPFAYLDGLEQAVTRSYADDDGGEGYISLELSASIARFTTDAYAEVAYDDVVWQYANGYASDALDATPEASEIAGLGDATAAFTSITHFTILLEWYLDTTVLVTRDAAEISIVTATFQVEQAPEMPRSGDLARTMMTSMLATEAGAAEGVENADGTFSGGLWEKLPPADHEALRDYGITSSWDHQDFPEIPDPDEATPVDEEDEGLDFTTLDGAVRAVARDYSGDIGTSLTPESGETSIPYVAVLVAEFERDDQAAAALGTIQEEALASVAGDADIPMEEVVAPELGDDVRARVGSVEEEGVRYEVALLVIQDGPYIYLVSAVGVGRGTGSGEAGTLELTTALAGAIVAADAGTGDGTFDDAGGSTGGLWDKLPAAGAPVLQGLTSDTDYVVYPEPAEGD